MAKKILKDVTNDENEGEFKLETEKNEEEEIYPEKLNGTQLEYDFIGILLSNPKLIMKYYFLYCKPAKPAGLAGLLFHGRGRSCKRHIFRLRGHFRRN